ncbi:hypothetical protein [Tardibacter chloracetimidivorans]|uniref:hypothetical protein n=1 Tax=Tardibacter chloracetimidivorans TaxID=1921510 RepID=UPI0013011B22|nr:hypothetical protein [Tardibacter chloracetimidivorans]
MAKYRVLKKSFIGNTIVEEGAIVDFNGQPGSNLEAIEETKAKPEPKAKTEPLA